MFYFLGPRLTLAYRVFALFFVGGRGVFLLSLSHDDAVCLNLLGEKLQVFQSARVFLHLRFGKLKLLFSHGPQFLSVKQNDFLEQTARLFICFLQTFLSGLGAIA